MKSICLILLLLTLSNLAYTQNRNNVCLSFYDDSNNLYGFELEGNHSFDETGVIFIYVLGKNFINGAKLKYYLFDLQCRHKFFNHENGVYKFIMRKGIDRKTCMCAITNRLLFALSELKNI